MLADSCWLYYIRHDTLVTYFYWCQINGPITAAMTGGFISYDIVAALGVINTGLGDLWSGSFHLDIFNRFTNLKVMF